MSIRRMGEAALLALCLALIVTLWAVVQETPDPNDRSVTVAPIIDGCLLRLHKIVHEIRPASECRSIGRALVQMAGP